MNKLLVPVIAFFASIPAICQEIQAGLNVGYNYSDLADNRFLPRRAVSGELVVDCRFMRSIVIGTGISYEQRGFAETAHTYSGETTMRHYHYDYLSIPLRGGLKLGKTFVGGANIGLNFSSLKNMEMIDGTGNVTQGNETGREISRFIEFLAGYHFNQITILSTFKFQKSFEYCYSHNTYGEFNHRVFCISVGCKVDLTKNQHK